MEKCMLSIDGISAVDFLGGSWTFSWVEGSRLMMDEGTEKGKARGLYRRAEKVTGVWIRSVGFLL